MKKIAIGMDEDTTITIDQKYYNATASLNDAEITNLKGIVVSVNQYSRFKFLVSGVNGSIQVIGYTTETIPNTWTTGDLPTGFIAIGENKQETPPGATTYTVTFKDGETTLSTATVEEGKTATKPTDPTKEGYDFVNWYSDSEFTTVYDFTSAINGDTTIYAKLVTAQPADPTAKFGEANSKYVNDFGKIVTGYGVGDTNEATITARTWRLFYADSNYAYLISDSIGKSALNNTRIVKGFGTSTISTLAENFNSTYTDKGDWTLKTDGNDLNNNIKAVAALLDTEQWKDYKSTDAEWAVGAPTLEMFVASYNETHSNSETATSLGVSNHTIAYNVESNTSTGYKVGLDGGALNNYIDGLGNTSNLDKAIY